MSSLAQLSDASRKPEFIKGDGMFLFDTSGKRYMDLISGIAVNNLGHQHPMVIDAIASQAKEHLHMMVYGEYDQKIQMDFAEKLTTFLPPQLNTVYPVNSGSEAIEGAMKLARRHTGRQEIISFTGAYHGSTMGALSLMGTDTFKGPFEPLIPQIKWMDFNHSDQIERITNKTACVIIEPVQGEAGYIPANPLYLKQLRERCNEVGALLVFDEVQTGMGRTGSLFAFEHFDVAPDVLVLAKALGGGMPLGAFITERSIMDGFKTNPHLGHITTFGGHPLSCAAAIANLEALTSGDLIQKAAQKEELFRKHLQHEHIVEIRGMGLMLAVDLGEPDFEQNVIDTCLDKGLLTDWFLFSEHSLRIAPPLIISNDEIKVACDIILSAIDHVKNGD